MSRQRGKREAEREKWHRGGDPFAADSPEQKKGRGLTGWKRTAAIAAGCVVVLALVVVGLWKALVVSPDVSEKTKPAATDTEDTEKETGNEETGDEPSTANGRKEDYFTFLLVGEDTSSGSTDTIMLASYDVKNQQVSLMSIPRDTMVNVSWDLKKINSVYSTKESNGGGMENLKKQVSYLTGVMPDFYVIVQWEAVGEIVEALGGVYFDVPFNMNYDDPYQDLHIHQEKGYRLLNGEDAMEVVRWRKNNDGTNYGDTTRVEVQQAFLKALAEQCLKLGNWTKVSAFAKIFAENVETDLPLNNLLWFAQQAMGLDMENLNVMTIPGNYNSYAWSRTYKNNQSYVFVYPEETVEMVNQYFNPYTEEITEDDLQIMYKNKDGSLGVTNGTLADAKAASAPVKSSGSSSSSGNSSSSGSSGSSGSSSNSSSTGGAGDTNTNTAGETTDPNTGATTDPGTGSTTDPNTGATTDPGTGGSTDPGAGSTTDPNVGGTTDPSAGGTTDPNTGGTTDPGSGGTTDPGTGSTTDPSVGGTTDPATGVPDDSVPPGWL